MFPLVAAAVGVQALGAVGKFLGGRSQAKEQRRQTAEVVRRQTLEAARTNSEAEALSQAMGVETSSGSWNEGSTSLTLYLNQMAAEFRRQIEWTRRTGAKQASNMSKAAGFGLFTDLAGTAFSAASMMGGFPGGKAAETGMSGLPATGRTMFSAEYD